MACPDCVEIIYSFLQESSKMQRLVILVINKCIEFPERNPRRNAVKLCRRAFFPTPQFDIIVYYLPNCLLFRIIFIYSLFFEIRMFNMINFSVPPEQNKAVHMLLFFQIAIIIRLVYPAAEHFILYINFIQQIMHACCLPNQASHTACSHPSTGIYPPGYLYY